MRSLLFGCLLAALSFSSLSAQPDVWNPDQFYECNFHRQQFDVEDRTFGRLINKFKNSTVSEQELAGFCFVPFVRVHCPLDTTTGKYGFTNLGYNVYLAYWEGDGDSRYLQLFGVDTNKHVYRLPMVKSTANSTYYSLLDPDLAAVLAPEPGGGNTTPASTTTNIPADFTPSDKGFFSPVISMQLSFLSINELKYLLLGTSYLRQDTMGTADAPDPDPEALSNYQESQDFQGQPTPSNEEVANYFSGNRSVIIERAIATQTFRIGSFENASVQRFRTLSVRPGIADSLSSLGIRELAVAMEFIPYCPPDWYDNDGPNQFFQNFEQPYTIDPFKSLSLSARALNEKYELTTSESVLEALKAGPERYIPTWIYLVILLLLAIIVYLVLSGANGPTEGDPLPPEDPGFSASSSLK